MTERNPALWNLLILATIIIAATVTLMIFDKKDLTKHTTEAHAKTKGSSTVKSHDQHAKDTTDAEPLLSNDDTNTKPDESRQQVKNLVSVSNTAAASSGEFILVAASFKNENHAQAFVTDFESKISWTNPQIIEHTQDTLILFRIVAQHSRSWKLITANRDSLIAAGYTDAWIYKQR